jgi:hypothetical protein
MRKVPISATNSTIIVRAQKISPILNPTYSLIFTDLNNGSTTSIIGTDLSTNPYSYNEFLIDNTIIGLRAGQHYISVQTEDVSVWDGIIDVFETVTWNTDNDLPIYSYDD